MPFLSQMIFNPSHCTELGDFLELASVALDPSCGLVAFCTNKKEKTRGNWNAVEMFRRTPIFSAMTNEFDHNIDACDFSSDWRILSRIYPADSNHFNRKAKSNWANSWENPPLTSDSTPSHKCACKDPFSNQPILLLIHCLGYPWAPFWTGMDGTSDFYYSTSEAPMQKCYSFP